MTTNVYIKSISLIIFVLCTLFVHSQIKDARLVVQNGHSLKINQAIFSPDGNYVASCSEDNKIILWDAKSGKQIRTFIGHKDEVNTICFSKNGKQLFSGSGTLLNAKDNSIKVWDFGTGKCLKTISCNYYIQKLITDCNGQYLIALSGNEKGSAIKIYNSNSLTELKAISIDETQAFDISPVGYLLAFHTHENDIVVSDLQGNIVTKSDGYGYEAIHSLKWSSDGKYILTSQGRPKTYDPNSIINITLWEYPSLKKIRTFTGHNHMITSICFSPDNKYILSGSFDKTVRLWDLETGNEVKIFRGHNGYVSSVNFSPDGKSVMSSSWDKTIRIWDVLTGEMLYSLKGTTQPQRNVIYSADGKNIYTGSDYGFVIWDMVNLTAIPYILTNTPEGFSIALTPDNSKLVCWSQSSVFLWDRLNNKVRELKTDISNICNIAISPDNELIAISNYYSISLVNLIDESHLDEISIKNIFKYCFSPDGNFLLLLDRDVIFWDLKKKVGKRFNTGLNDIIQSISVSPDQKFIAISHQNIASDDRFVSIIDFATLNLIYKSKPFGDNINSLCFSKDNTLLTCGCGCYHKDGNVIKIFDIEKKKELESFSGHNLMITSVAISPDKQYIASVADDNRLIIWNLQSKSKVVNMCLVNQKDWLLNTDDGYFDCSRYGCEGLALETNLHGLGIDQLAYVFNRPDKIFDVFCQNSELGQYYKQCYLKRLKRIKLDEKKISSNIHVPKVSINYTKVEGKYVIVDFSLTDSKYDIKTYNFFVNDVPLFGIEGRKVSDRNFNYSEKIELTTGDNKIEVSCMNETGMESYRALSYIKCNIKAKSNLYFLGFGVSKYKNSSYNLLFADKDALDLEKVVLNFKGEGFENVYTKVLTNEQVTPASIKAAKDFLKAAKPDDTFILFIAGHGMHDTDPEATYYFLTSNADLKNLKGTAADFETIEDLLQGIPPRNKLFLMDACESGEIDEEDQGLMLAAATGVGIASRGFKTVAGEKGQVISGKRTYLYQKDRYIYNDLVRRSGAIVFSSSKGGELSYERSDIENGLFTEYIMKALTTTEADKDNNGIVSTDELRNYVSAEVAKASGDLQHPTVDRDNIYQKFGFKVN